MIGECRIARIRNKMMNRELFRIRELNSFSIRRRALQWNFEIHDRYRFIGQRET
jgi:hypothetical protein